MVGQQSPSHSFKKCLKTHLSWEHLKQPHSTTELLHCPWLWSLSNTGCSCSFYTCLVSTQKPGGLDLNCSYHVL